MRHCFTVMTWLFMLSIIALSSLFVSNKSLFFLVNGGYGNWSPWGRCNRSCGQGTQVRKRFCNNPSPSMLGKSCTVLGPSIQVQRCNVMPCPGIIMGCYAKSIYFYDMSCPIIVGCSSPVLKFHLKIHKYCKSCNGLILLVYDTSMTGDVRGAPNQKWMYKLTSRWKAVRFIPAGSATPTRYYKNLQTLFVRRSFTKDKNLQSNYWLLHQLWWQRIKMSCKRY